MKKDIMAEKEEIKDIPEIIPVMPLRNAVLFPEQIMPLSVGREKSLNLMKEVEESKTEILVVAQKSEEVDDPDSSDIYDVGTVCTVVKIFKLPDGTEHVVVQGLRRAKIIEFIEKKPFLKATIESLEEMEIPDKVEVEALVLNIRNTLDKIIDLSPQLHTEHRVIFNNTDDPRRLTDLAAVHLNLTLEERQEILSLIDPVERLRKLHFFAAKQLQVLEIGSRIQNEVQGELNKTQRQYVLREQLKAIKRELGEDDGQNPELSELKEKIEAANLPPAVKEIAEKELNRLYQIPPAMAEYSVIRAYLDWITDLPWQTETEENLDLKNAAAVLDEDHYGLEKVKERILEFLAVLSLKKDKKSPILCFVGPPGVGKTSLGQSIARALNRKFVRMALGGLHDEAEIRGHRRTYVGAMPGRIIQGIKKVKANNPVFMLDEIDKMGRDFRGDPSSALLEVLDPEQNFSFTDNYLEIEFDLSRTFFIATANVLDTIPPALRDRMDIIEIPGYTEEEKIEIAKRYLIPKQIKEHGLRNGQIKFRDKALKTIINRYTREAGVRNLERRIADVCRKIARGIVEEKFKSKVISEKILSEILGAPRFSYDLKERTAQSGVATGLAWTPAGGDILFIEATGMPGNGELKLTGQLGEVMKESANIALSVLRSRAKKLKLNEDFYKKYDIHLHVPAGAIPKDGPSAGITMLTALYSLLSGKKVRNDLAMTGEITLRGQILPIGGVKEKVLAAKRAGISHIILPKKNKRDLEEIPPEHLEGLEFHFTADCKEVLKLAIID
jgi:ATP-dependent Lon protease